MSVQGEAEEAYQAALYADIDWSKVSEDLVRKLGRTSRLQRALDTPLKQRTALDAANCALARLISAGTFR